MQTRRRHCLLAIALLAGCAQRQAGAPDALDQSIARLTVQLRSDDESTREGAQTALVAIGAPVIPAVSKVATADPESDVRQAAITVLERIATPAAIDPLLAALHDKDSEVRLRAVEALGTRRDPRAVAPLMAQYGADDDNEVRYECLTSLGKIGDPHATDLLVRETDSHDRYARMWAMDALCTLGSDRTPQLAVVWIGDPDANVRQQVLRSCATALDTPAGRAALIRVAVFDADFDSSVAARRILEPQLKSGAAAPALREEIRSVARPALTGGQPVNAALMLAEIGDPAGASELRRALHDPNTFVRHHAAFYLGQVGGPADVPALIAALSDSQSLVAATAYDSLLVFAGHGDRTAQTAVAQYKGKRFDKPLGR